MFVARGAAVLDEYWVEWATMGYIPGDLHALSRMELARQVPHQN